MSRNEFGRRRFLYAVGAAGAVAIAGCSGDDDGGDGGDGDDGGGSDGTDGGGSDRTDDGGGSEDAVEAPDDVADFLSDANNFDGEMVDATGEDEVAVDVGAGDGLAFGPAAVQVSTGTAVRWEWTGEGGTHNVSDEDGAFRSGSAVDSSEETFEHAFDESGTYLYVCEPHESVDMLGAVVAE